MQIKNWQQKILVVAVAAAFFFTVSGPALGAVKLVKGQTVYIPSYANVISGPPILMVVPLRANLIIHNTDPSHAITLEKIDHYDTNGKLVYKYLEKPLILKPLAATRIILKPLAATRIIVKPLAATRIIVKEPKQGSEGVGANFIVQWHANQPVNAPLIDCLMLGTLGNQGFSFTSQGKVIQETAK